MTALVFVLCTILLILEITFFKNRHPERGHHGHNTGCKIEMNGVCSFIVLALLHGIELNNENVSVVLLRLTSECRRALNEKRPLDKCDLHLTILHHILLRHVYFLYMNYERSPCIFVEGTGIPVEP